MLVLQFRAMKENVVFMGSPAFALPTLQALADNYHVIGVVTQPDRPAGRGRQLTPPPVKTLALSLGIEVIQPERLRQPEAQEKLRAWSPDLIVVTAFGQILRQNVLDLPRFGCINVHASLLPRWRGAAPIQAAILHGDTITGATIMRMDPGIDTGPIFSQCQIPILPEDTAGSLAPRLAHAGAALLIDTLPAYLSGHLQPQPQDESLATYAPMLKKEQGSLEFSQSVTALANRVRAFNPWPGAVIQWAGQPLKVHQARALIAPIAKPGERLVIDGLPAIAAADGWLLLEEVQPAGKRVMSGSTFLLGARGWAE
jgi:methionyl-tRNA formyltransferase